MHHQQRARTFLQEARLAQSGVDASAVENTSWNQLNDGMCGEVTLIVSCQERSSLT